MSLNNGRRLVGLSMRAKFEACTVVTDTCWIWTGSVTSAGYGNLRAENKRIYAHRFSYELHVGPIPRGLEIDHLCRVRNCVNPAHLEAVTHRENVLRSEAPPAKHAVKTHCVNGHALIEDNYYLSGRGARVCLSCNREQSRRYRASLRAKAAAA